MGMYDALVTTMRGIYDRRITTGPVLDQAVFFADAARFRAAWQTLRDEAAMVSLPNVPRFHEIMAAQTDLSTHDGRDWRVLILRAYGVNWKANLAACPHLAEVVAACPDVLSASLSFLAPGKHIPPHRGPFRGVLRYQLTLVSPTDDAGQPAAVLTVDSVEHRIGAGQDLLWDDTFTHEVTNRSDQVRIALLLDVRRRRQPVALAILSRFLIGCVAVASWWTEWRGRTRSAGKPMVEKAA